MPGAPRLTTKKRLYVFDHVRRQALEVATDVRQGIGIHALGPLFDGFFDVLISSEVNFGFAIFQEFFYGFLFEPNHG